MGLSRGYMSQLLWHIDEQNLTGAASDNNKGDDPALPLLTDRERASRMGPKPFWNAGLYKVRYLSDVPASRLVGFHGFRASNSAIQIHGSATDGQGQSTIHSGTVNALTSLSRATNQPYEIVSNALASTWAAAGALDHRIRLTSGATGAKAWPIKDLGSKRARISQFTAKNTYGVPFTSGTSSAAVATSNTFVVEKLTAIPNFLWTIQAADDAGTNTTFEPNVIESVDIGVGNLVLAGQDWLTFDGCSLRMYADNPAGGMNMRFIGCGFRDEVFFPSSFTTPVQVFGGYSQGGLVFCEESGGSPWFDLDFMVQGNTLKIQSGRRVLLGNVAVLDSPSSGINVSFAGRVQSTGTIDANSSGANWWGAGNATVGLRVGSNARIIGGPSAGTITGTSGDVSLGTIVKPWADMPAIELVGGGGMGANVE